MNWFPIKNASSANPIPAFGLCRVTGFDATIGAFTVDAPNKDNQAGLVINGETVIFPSAAGKGTLDDRVIVSFNDADGTPAVGDSWGAKSGEYRLRKNYAGFLILGGGYLSIINTLRLSGGGSSDGGFWVLITGGSDSAGYSGTRVERSGGSWVAATSPTPLTWSSAIYRAPSNVASPNIPAIPVNQVVRAWTSPADATKLEIPAPGGIQTFTDNVVTAVSCVGATLAVTTKTLTIRGRDLTASLV